MIDTPSTIAIIVAASILAAAVIGFVILPPIRRRYRAATHRKIVKLVKQMPHVLADGKLGFDGEVTQRLWKIYGHHPQWVGQGFDEVLMATTDPEERYQLQLANAFFHGMVMKG